MKLRKILCVVLALCMLVTGISLNLTVCADDQTGYTHEWEHECLTECKGECGTNPVIIVPGIMQSQVYVQDENGEDLMTSDGFPIVEGMDMAFMFDTVALGQAFKDKIVDILKCVITGDKDGLLDIVLGILDKSFSSHYFNADGTRKNGVDVDEYWYSLEVAKTMPEKSYNYAKGYSKDDNGNVLPTTKYKNEAEFITRQVDITAYCEKYGYDHCYYFAYSSFGSVLETAAKLNEFIEMVKVQTGHDKVNIVFISLGGTIGNAYLAKYCNPDDIDRIVYAACAADGSYLLGDLMAGASTLGELDVIYHDLIPNIVDLAAKEYKSLAYVGNGVARIIPESLFKDFLSKALTRGVNEVIGKLIHNCPSMWALTPSDMYPELSQKLISDEAHKALKEQTDEYYEIQKNAGKKMQELREQGVEIFVVCGYDMELPALVEHWDVSSDNIIQSASTSLGGTFAKAGEKLPADYKPAIDASYISPDGNCDAGTCALPDYTWFIKGQSHLALQGAVEDVIQQCIDICVNKDIKDARVDNGGYPQFNEYRDLTEIRKLIKTYENADLSTLSDEQKTAVDAAYEKAVKLVESRSWSQSETDEVAVEFSKAMGKAGITKDSSFVNHKLLPAIEKALAKLSDFFFGFLKDSDYWHILKQILNAISSLLKSI